MTVSMTNALPVGSASPVILAAQPMIDTQGIDLGHMIPALALASRELRTFPLAPGKKVPIVINGHLKATTDLSRIGSWWTQVPLANIGIRPDEHVVVIDVDPRDGGATNLVRFLDGRELPPTLTVNTGGVIPGLHIYYRMGMGSWRQKLVPGVDLKSSSGYLVAPPSIHPDTGRRYEWANDLPIADAPDWLIAACLRPAQPAVRPVARLSNTGRGDRLTGVVRFVLEAPTGERNNRLNWAAYTCRGLNHQQVTSALLVAAEETGLPRAEAERTIRSGLRAGVAR